MAVPKSRTSRAKRNSRAAHHAQAARSGRSPFHKLRRDQPARRGKLPLWSCHKIVFFL